MADSNKNTMSTNSVYIPLDSEHNVVLMVKSEVGGVGASNKIIFNAAGSCHRSGSASSTKG